MTKRATRAEIAAVLLGVAAAVAVFGQQVLVYVACVIIGMAFNPFDTAVPTAPTPPAVPGVPAVPEIPAAPAVPEPGFTTPPRRRPRSVHTPPPLVRRGVANADAAADADPVTPPALTRQDAVCPGAPYKPPSAGGADSESWE
jgi:hypothetical protein